MGLLTLAAYMLGEYVLGTPGTADGVANTMAFATLTMCQLFHAFDVRSEHHSLLHIGIFSNKAMNKAFLVGMAHAARRAVPAAFAVGVRHSAPGCGGVGLRTGFGRGSRGDLRNRKTMGQTGGFPSRQAPGGDKKRPSGFSRTGVCNC